MINDRLAAANLLHSLYMLMWLPVSICSLPPALPGSAAPLARLMAAPAVLNEVLAPTGDVGSATSVDKAGIKEQPLNMKTWFLLWWSQERRLRLYQCFFCALGKKC